MSMIRVYQPKKNKKTTDSSDLFHDEEELTEASSSPRALRAISQKCDDGLEEKPRQTKQTKKNETKASATSAALRILQSGANSSRMLREKLARKGFEKDEIEEAVAFVVDAGFVHDEKLLHAHAEYLAERKYYGKSRIRMALSQKFDRQAVDCFFEAAVEEIDFSAYCLKYARKHASKGREALIASLKRQGYQTAEIRYALSSLAEESNL